MAASPDYLLSVGEKGALRLELQSKMIANSSQAFLQKAGLSSGMNVLEIGCGTGPMTVWLAQQVGPNGHVYAVDISEEQIAIAKKRAEAHQCKNITFIVKNIFDLSAGTMDLDLIYTRFVLMHLKAQFRALEALQQLLKVGGKLVCEEMTNSALFCYPALLPYEVFRKMILKLFEIRGLDSEFGNKIYSYFRQLSFQNIQVQLYQPVYQTPDERRIIPLVAEEIKPHIIASNLMKEAEMNQLIEQLYTASLNEEQLITPPRTTQIFGTKM
jgi:ubiquinone/menaquinone biosynthesis C-methylase UbiE